MGWMLVEKETVACRGGLHAAFGGAPPPPPPPPPAHPISAPPVARRAIASAPGVRIVAPSWGSEPLAHDAGDGKQRAARDAKAQWPLSSVVLSDARCASSSERWRRLSRTRFTSPCAHSISCGGTLARALRS